MKKIKNHTFLILIIMILIVIAIVIGVIYNLYNDFEKSERIAPGISIKGVKVSRND